MGCWGLPPVRGERGIRFDQNAENYIVSFIDLDGQIVTSEFRREFGFQSKVRLICHTSHHTSAIRRHTAGEH